MLVFDKMILFVIIKTKGEVLTGYWAIVALQSRTYLSQKVKTGGNKPVVNYIPNFFLKNVTSKKDDIIRNFGEK